jgi:YD repeat-containing protein
MSDGWGSTNWTYDVRGRKLSEQKTINGAADQFTTSWTYNSSDMPVSMTYSDGEVVSLAYNVHGKQSGLISSQAGYINDVAYDEAGWVTSMGLVGNTRNAALTNGYSYHD